MKIGAIPESLAELLLTGFGAIPTPLIDTFQAHGPRARSWSPSSSACLRRSRTSRRRPKSVAASIGADPHATEKLLGALVGSGYLHWRDRRFSLAAVACRWLLKDSPQSLHDNMLHRFLEWEVVEKFEDFVRTGKPLHVHEDMPPAKWEIYQRGMRSLAGLSAAEVCRRLPMPAGGGKLLDLGGAHGCYSVAALCRRYPQLAATILDLPQAVACARPILAKENMGDRIVFRAENVLGADLGHGEWDCVFVSQLLHHFDAETNRQLLARVSRSLRPGGIVAILEVLRPTDPNSAGQTGALLDLFFAVTSRSGSWSVAELAGWQRQAGLLPNKPIPLRSIPGSAIQVAKNALY